MYKPTSESANIFYDNYGMFYLILNEILMLVMFKIKI